MEWTAPAKQLDREVALRALTGGCYIVSRAFAAWHFVICHSSSVIPMTRVQRIELFLFIACFFAFAYFNQGGGWNQNARFAEVRAIVEQGRFAIDDFLIYKKSEDGGDLVRLPLKDAEYTHRGQRFRLCWVDMEWSLFPVGEKEHPMEPGVEKAAMIEITSSGDIAYVPATGHFHPNKPPGTSFLAVPGYFIIYHVERMLGINPDGWWALGVNAWLVSVCSVALLSALGCVLFFRIAREMAGALPRSAAARDAEQPLHGSGAELPALLATLTLAFGTTFFPFATLLFDHNLTAALLIAGFYFLWRTGQKTLNSQLSTLNPQSAASADRSDVVSWKVRVGSSPLLPLLAGFCAGFAVVTNYVAIGGVAALGLYALLGTPGLRRNFAWRNAFAFCLGGAGPALLLMAYGWICFGSPFRLNNDFQNPLFAEKGAALFGMIGMPNGYVGTLLLASPFRGLFFFSPVLLLGFYGLFVWLREKRFAAEARLCLGIFAWFFYINMSFNGYHAGFSAGPRYLVPGIPFLALPLVVVFQRLRSADFGLKRWILVLAPAVLLLLLSEIDLLGVQSKLLWWVILLSFIGAAALGPRRQNWLALACALAGISVFNHLLLTATDAQNPVGVGGHARVEGKREEWSYNLLGDYAWPLFTSGRAWPLLREQISVQMEAEQERIAAETDDPAERTRRAEELRAAFHEGILRGEPSPFLLGSVEGPVSVNPLGVYEGLFTYNFFPPGTPQCRWASFNLGEFVAPQSRWSLLPLLLISGGLAGLALRESRRQTL